MRALREFWRTLVAVVNGTLRRDPVFVSDRAFRARLAICGACPAKMYIRRALFCGVCKCSMGAKARLREARCPDGKW